MQMSTFRAPLVAATFLFIAGGLACQQPDADTLAKGMKAKMPLPQKIDDDTRLDDVRAVGKKELGYFMTLTRMTKAQADANPAFGNLLESNLRGGACKNPNYEKLMTAGFSVRLTYTSSDGAEVKTIVITPKDCGA
jgi:hypothetical protein